MRAILALLVLGMVSIAIRAAEDRPRSAPEGRSLFLSRCSSCHDPGRVHHRRADRDEWREIVDRMRRMPQSGISPREAEIILDYLVSLGEGAPAPQERVLGGRAAYGPEWLSILEVATVREDRVRLGGVLYEVEADGLELTLRPDKEIRHVVSLTGKGAAGRTARVRRWKAGKVAYEVHLVLYAIRGDEVRVARALRRIPPVTAPQAPSYPR
jgi:hypothetical protein